MTKPVELNAGHMKTVKILIKHNCASLPTIFYLAWEEKESAIWSVLLFGFSVFSSSISICVFLLACFLGLPGNVKIIELTH